MITINLLIILVAFICALLAAIDVKAPRVNLGWLAIALWLLAMLIK